MSRYHIILHLECGHQTEGWILDRIEVQTGAKDGPGSQKPPVTYDVVEDFCDFCVVFPHTPRLPEEVRLAAQQSFGIHASGNDQSSLDRAVVARARLVGTGCEREEKSLGLEKEFRHQARSREVELSETQFKTLIDIRDRLYKEFGYAGPFIEDEQTRAHRRLEKVWGTIVRVPMGYLTELTDGELGEHLEWTMWVLSELHSGFMIGSRGIEEARPLIQRAITIFNGVRRQNEIEQSEPISIGEAIRREIVNTLVEPVEFLRPEHTHCGICKEAFAKGDEDKVPEEAVNLLCPQGHEPVGRTCIIEGWLSQNMTCPFCRFDFTDQMNAARDRIKLARNVVHRDAIWKELDGAKSILALFDMAFPPAALLSCWEYADVDEEEDEHNHITMARMIMAVRFQFHIESPQ